MVRKTMKLCFQIYLEMLENFDYCLLLYISSKINIQLLINKYIKIIFIFLGKCSS